MFDVFDVGDPMVIGGWQNFQEENVNSLVRHAHRTHPMGVTLEQMEAYIDMFDVNYDLLPDYLRDRIDEVNIIDVD